MSLPYFPLYPTDFEADTSHLTLAEDGAYNRLLRLQWMTPGCTLPDDDTWIMRRMRCSREEFEAVVKTILDEFFTRKDGRVFSARLRDEWKKVDETSRKRSAAGKLGGRPRTIENKEKTQKAGLVFDKAGPKQPEPEPEPERDTLEANASNDADGVNSEPVDATKDAIWKRGVPFLTERGVPERQARSAIGKWLRDSGASELYDALAQAAASGTGDPIPYITEILKPMPSFNEIFKQAVAASVVGRKDAQ